MKNDKNCWIEINLKALKRNLASLRKIIKKEVKILGVVKQEAYGLGLRVVAKFLSREGIDFLGVNNCSEAYSLIEDRIKTPVLILSNTLDTSSLDFLVKRKIRFSVMDYFLLKALDKTARKNNTLAFIHIKVDTGMNRLGLNFKEAFSFIKEACSFKNVVIEGVFSHFSSAEKDYSYTLSQIKKFNSLRQLLEEKRIKISLFHICNSAGTLNFPQAHLNMVRCGLILYGVKPSPELNIPLWPVVSLKTKILFIKKVPPNSFISYNRTFKTKRTSRIGIIGAGYAQGYPWSLSNRGEVLVRGRKAKILGRVCMDHMVIDLTDIKGLKQGDEVILIGGDKPRITVEELAEQAQTIPYEILTRLSLNLPRIYT